MAAARPRCRSLSDRRPSAVAISRGISAYKAAPRTVARLRPAPRLRLVPGGDETDDLRFGLHLPYDFADLVPRQLRFREANAIELPTHVERAFDQGRLVGTEEVGDVIRGGLRRKAHDGEGALAWRTREAWSARSARLFDHDRSNHDRLQDDRNSGRRRRPRKRPRSKARQEFRDTAAEVERAL